MLNLNRSLLKTLGLGWLAFLVTGLLISSVFAMPTVTLLIDRSYCPPNQWQQISQTYTDLYHQHQWRKIHLKTVIFFSSLDQEVLNSPPAPAMVADLSTYGRSSQQRQKALQKTYPDAQILSCQVSNP